MTAEQEITQKKLTLLQIAIKIRNISEACRAGQGLPKTVLGIQTIFHELGFIFLGLNDIASTQRTPFSFDIKKNMGSSSNVGSDRSC